MPASAVKTIQEFVVVTSHRLLPLSILRYQPAEKLIQLNQKTVDAKNIAGRATGKIVSATDSG